MVRENSDLCCLCQADRERAPVFCLFHFFCAAVEARKEKKKAAVLVDGAFAWSTVAIDLLLFGSCFLHFTFLVRVSIVGDVLVLDG